MVNVKSLINERNYKLVFAVGYAAVLAVTFMPLFGSLSSIKVGPEAFHIRLDFLLHFVVYSLIGIYYLIGNKFGFHLFTQRPLLKYFGLVLLLAVVTEIFQLWVPSRAFNIFDLISNVAGTVLGAVISSRCS